MPKSRYWQPKVGDKVRLNNDGMSRLRLDDWQTVEEARESTVTSVEDINAGTGAEPIWVINVSGRRLNRYMLESSMFTKLP